MDRCTKCERPIDTDFDTDCYHADQTDWGKRTAAVCAWCRQEAAKYPKEETRDE